MTENKRFTVTQDFEEHHRQIRDNGHIIMGCFIESQAEVIVNLLNELHYENYNLELHSKSQSKAYHKLLDSFTRLKRKNKELKEENEQLKKQLQSEHQMLENAILLERTRMGQNALKQYKEAIQ